MSDPELLKKIEHGNVILETYGKLAEELNCSKTALQHFRWYNMGSYTQIPERSFQIMNEAFVNRKCSSDFISCLNEFITKANYASIPSFQFISK